MKSMLQLLVLAALALCGCTERRFGPQLTEPGEIFETCYVPSGHGSGIGVGMTSRGSMAVTSESVDIPERFAVVFKCQHGKFVIEGDRARDLYKQFEKGDRVTIIYQEIFEERSGKWCAVDLKFNGATRRQ